MTSKKIILSNKKDLTIITFFMLLANIISQGIPTLIKVLSDNLTGISIIKITIIGIGLIFLGFIEYFSNILADKFYFSYTNKIGNELLEKFLKALLNTKSSKIRKYNPDNLLRMATDDINQLKKSIVKEFFISVSTIVSIITLLCFVIHLDYKLAILTIIWYLLYFSLSNKLINTIYKKRYVERQEYTNIVSYSKDVIFGANDFKYFANCNLFFDKIKKINNKYNEANVKLMISSSMANYLTYIGSFTNIALIMLYKYFYANDVSTGTLLAMFMYTSKYADLFQNILYLKTLIKDNKAMLEPYNEIIADNTDTKLKIDKQINHIVLKNLSINYEGKSIVKDFNYDFTVGKIYIISGTSGKGKTSILNSIVNEIDFNGEIFINNINSNKISKECINDRFAYINQNVYLINGTIQDNINLFNTEPFNNLIVKNILGFSNPDFYLGNSEIDKISGGERKRIAFGRLLRCIELKDVILIDETFANLDKENSQKIATSIIDKIDEKILIIVSHDDFIKNIFRTDQTEYIEI
ncbi:MAG: ABC transporter ATP-binding protein [Spirochaetaceae bacterium]|nr:ABC transporter ATP-binding protein [Spirochaetaceae bacterium]